MSIRWPTIKIGDLVNSGEAELKTGPFGTQLHASDYVHSGTPVINVRNIGFGNIRPDKLEFISDETVQRLSSHLLTSGDLVFGRKGAVERHVFIKSAQEKWFQGSDCLRVRFSSKRMNPRFASYYCLTEDHQAWMMGQCSHGATMASLNQEILGRIELPFPPLPTQNKIVAVLSAYDDLIENNTRRLQILEEMARAIYREWFVEFRFPGHENLPMVETALGQTPATWDVKAIGECVDTLGGGTPTTGNPLFWDEGDVVWFSPTDLTSAKAMFVADSAKHITPAGVRGSSTRLFPPYSVMMTSRATIGVVAINTREACTNQGFIVLVPSERLPYLYLYFWLREQHEKINSLATGATFKEISRGTFRQMLIAVPNVEVAQVFRDTTQPIGTEIENLLKKNNNLRRTRDLLLPKLVSGEVDISDLEIVTDS